MWCRFLSCFIAGGLMPSISFGAKDRTNIDCEHSWEPYVILRGGLTYGQGKYHHHVDGLIDWIEKRSLKDAWSGSGEFGIFRCDDRMHIGLELGYFTEKLSIEHLYNPPILGMTKVGGEGRFENFFGACNITWRRDCTELLFLYGGVGAGIVRSILSGEEYEESVGRRETSGFYTSKWHFFGQVFTGVGVHLNDRWALTIGYRLRCLPGDLKLSVTEDGYEWESAVTKTVLHIAEVGLTYRF